MKFPIVLCAIMSIGFLAQTAHAKILAKCDIVEALERFKFPRSFLSNCKYGIAFVANQLSNSNVLQGCA